MSTYPEHNSVKRCLEIIEKKLQWGDAQNWHNDVFLELSEKIKDDTSVLLSVTTLKRVWGKVKYNSAPSISTLNTLAQFAGYTNWRDFKGSIEDKEKPNWFSRTINPNMHIIIISAVVLALGFISVFSVANVSEDNSTQDFSKVKFNSQPVTNTLPNSVIFDLNLDGITSDSIYIQQYWDVTKTIKVNADQKQATGIYYYPGYFNATLRVDGKVVREHDLFIKSEGWLGTLDYKPVPKYVDKANIVSQKISFPEVILEEIKQREKPLQSAFHYVDNFRNVSGDNIKISQTVNTVLNEKWAVCQSLRIVILGSESAIIIPFSKLGCVSNLGLMMSDVYLSGKKNDLSMFGVDLSENQKIDIEIIDKNVTVSIADKIIYSGKYNTSIGRFVGIRYRFIGAGQIHELQIKDLNKKKTVLETDFAN
ncbi:hypothetical protein [Seonamhaeicola marinus]|uniref:Uncharacterized protein n=1 Tax=Seonamhaeicola marinus TaxID=1912246 RepID=A0A5D0HLU5_9FLAO|nr:hypothetical protein [Seonamhaeicola marinus]TYA71960.1 hypothetical protein FUA24_20645 [Seonamhaeicola marinus]